MSNAFDLLVAEVCRHCTVTVSGRMHGYYTDLKYKLTKLITFDTGKERQRRWQRACEAAAASLKDDKEQSKKSAEKQKDGARSPRAIH